MRGFEHTDPIQTERLLLRTFDPGASTPVHDSLAPRGRAHTTSEKKKRRYPVASTRAARQENAATVEDLFALMNPR